MEKLKNNKIEKKSIMKLFSIISLMFLTLLTPSFASQEDQNFIVNWKLDEGDGSIAFDSSSNNYLGVLSNGANFETANGIAFGFSDVDFDGGNDILQTNLGANFGDGSGLYSFSFWFKADTTDDDVVMNLYSSTGNLDLRFEIDPNGANDQLDLVGFDNLGTPIDYTIQTGDIDFIVGTYYHILLTFNQTSQEWNYYRDSLLSNTFTTSNINLDNGEDFILRFGTDKDQVLDFDGDIDEVKVFDFIVNQSQVNSLYTSNNIVLAEPPEPEIPQEEVSTIFNSYLPSVNQSVVSPVNFQMNLNVLASCDLYIDNQLRQSFDNNIAYNYNLQMPVGTHNYMIYCHYIENGTDYFEITPLNDFEVVEPADTLISFQFGSTEFDVNSESLYVVTPCFENSYSEYYEFEDDEEYYVQAVTNGVAQFNVEPTQHEFCLYNGLISYDQNTYTHNVHLNKILKETKLGTFDVPNNVSQSYSLSLERADVFSVVSVDFWDTSWGALFELVIGVLLGGIIIFIGSVTGQSKLSALGVLVILAGMGVSMSTFVGLIFN